MVCINVCILFALALGTMSLFVGIISPNDSEVAYI